MVKWRLEYISVRGYLSGTPLVTRETTRPGLAMIDLDFVFWTSVLASVNQEQGRVSFNQM